MEIFKITKFVYVFVIGVTFLISFFGTKLFRNYAIKKGVVAEPNFRSSHQFPKPRGGGIVFAIAFVSFILGISVYFSLNYSFIFVLVIGGAAAAIFGLIDDIINIAAEKKLVFQGVLSFWILFWWGGQPFFDILEIKFIVYIISWFVLVWLLNLYNFIDGIDGMAGSACILISLSAITVLLIIGVQVNTPIVFIYGILIACTLGFLALNWPPAKIFMGDAGSLFLGYTLSALLVSTIANHQISFWTWLIIFGYFAGDTTTTTILRIFLVKRWYGEHRSHAYQNLARVWNNHLKVLSIVIAYHILYLLPLAIWSVLNPSIAPMATFLSLSPVIIWTLRYGPLFSKV